MPDIPQNIRRKNFIQAINKINEQGIPDNAKSENYELIYEANGYPAMLVVSWANLIVNGEELDRELIADGDGKECFRLLKREGFSIEPKDSNSERYKLWDEFLEEWPESRVREMTLAEYTGVHDHSVFCYWIETRLKQLGSILGGSAFKFGIYKRDDQTPKGASKQYTYSNEYAWVSKLGETEEQAFDGVKNQILTVISCIRANDMQGIDSIPLWPVVKWKIAFLYQDRESPKVAAVYKKENIVAYLSVDNDDTSKNTPHSELYNQLMLQREKQGNDDIVSFSRSVWTTADRELDKQRFLPKDAEEILQERYESIANGTKYIIGFLNNSSKTIALSRSGSSVRVTTETWEVPDNLPVSIKERYSIKDTRNSNFGSQAPNVAVGKEAILIECNRRDAFESLLDAYDGEDRLVEMPLENKEEIALPGSQKVQNQLPLNQILYGPPGTGKTYNTVNKALEIVDPEFYQQNKEDRELLNKRFRKLSSVGLIGFVTFHQSFSYEDFVEGLRASASDGQISYDVEDGVFKDMCASGEAREDKASFVDLDVSGRQVWKMSLGNTLSDDSNVFDNCIEADEIRLGYGENTDFSQCSTRDEIMKQVTPSVPDVEKKSFIITAVDVFKNQMEIGDLVVISDGNLKFRAIAEITGEYRCSPNTDFGVYGQMRKVTWHRVYDNSLPYQRIMDKKFSQMTIYKLKPNALNLEKFKNILQAGSAPRKRALSVGMQLGNSDYIVESVSDELVRVKTPKTSSVIPFDLKMLEELASYVRAGKLTLDDIAKKRVFEKTETVLEKFIVNGYPRPIANLVEVLAGEESANSSLISNRENARVLIIDEINRGNISSIFGELITLIEPNKRAGAAEALSVTLPYSKKEFQVPGDLHIIGTMNTADRSLALMDTALRRRFDFVEMMPNIKLLRGVKAKGIDIAEMILLMNKRIEVLYDREHALGHAFFMGLIDEDDDGKRFILLAGIFSNKILPLLEEYFFEDWTKIRLVLGDDNKDSEFQFIKENGKEYDAESLTWTPPICQAKKFS